MKFNGENHACLMQQSSYNRQKSSQPAWLMRNIGWTGVERTAIQLLPQRTRAHAVCWRNHIAGSREASGGGMREDKKRWCGRDSGGSGDAP